MLSVDVLFFYSHLRLGIGKCRGLLLLQMMMLIVGRALVSVNLPTKPLNFGL